MAIFYFVFVFLLTLGIFWQLFTGKTPNRGLWPMATRRGDPFSYWLILLAQSALLAVALISGKTSWHWHFS